MSMSFLGWFFLQSTGLSLSVCGYLPANTRLECVGPRGYDDIRVRIDTVYCRYIIQDHLMSPDYELLYSFGDVVAVPGTPDYKVISTDAFAGNVWTDVDFGYNYHYYIANMTMFYAGTFYATFGLRNKTTRFMEHLNVYTFTVKHSETPCEPYLHVEGLGACGHSQVLEEGRDLELEVSPRVTSSCDTVLTSYSRLQWLTLSVPTTIRCSGEYPAKDDQRLGDGVGGCYQGKCNVTYHLRIPRSCVQDKAPVKVSSRTGAAATSSIKVRVPGRNDRTLHIICPCCEYTKISGEPIFMEARPQRTEIWGTRYPEITWRITDSAGARADIELYVMENGGIIEVANADGVASGDYHFTAESSGSAASVLIQIKTTQTLFEERQLRQQDDLPPIRGNCTITPRRGVAVLSHFRLTCMGFVDYDDTQLTFEFYYCDLREHEVQQHMFRTLRQACILLKSKLNDSTFGGVLPQGRPENKYEALIVVFCIDSTGEFSYTTVDVVVDSGNCSSVTLKDVTQYQRDAAAWNTEDDSSATVSDTLSYIQSSSIMLKSDFYRGCDNEMDGQVLENQTHVRENFVEYLSNVPISSEGDLQKAAEVLDAILPTNNSEANKNITEAAIVLVDKYVDAYEAFAAEEVDGRIGNRTVAVGEAVAETITAVLNITVPPPRETPSVVPENFSTTPECVTAEMLIENLGRIAKSVSRVVDTEVEDLSIMYEDYELWIRESQRTGFLGSFNGTKVRLLSRADQQTSIVFPASPFRCHRSGRFSNTQAVSVNASVNVGGRRGRWRSMRPVRAGMETFLRRADPLAHDDSTTYQTSLHNVSVHRLGNAETDAYLRVHLVPVRLHEEFIFAVAVNRTPNRKDFMEQNSYYVNVLVGHHHRWINIDQGGEIFIAVLPLTNDTAAVLRDPHFSLETIENRSMMYGLQCTLYVCMYWNTKSRVWATGGCRPLPDSDRQFVHCVCNHTSIFTAGLFVAPTPIHFAELSVILRDMTENFLMLAVILIIWCIYILVAVWAVGADTRDEGALGIEYLAENDPEDEFGYLISVYTCFRRGSGTSSQVLFKVLGEDSESRESVIRDGAHNPLALQTGGRDWYFLSSPDNLGTIRTVVVTIIAKGNRLAWTVDTIVVRDLQSTVCYVFVVDDVLCPDAYRGKTTYEFERADDSVLQNPWRIFKAQLVRNFREEHLIFSTFNRHTTGNFTRRQRASVTLLLVLSEMLVSLMFYGTTGDKDEKFEWNIVSSIVEVPDRREVTIALESAAIVTPMVFVVMFLFGRSRQQAFRRRPQTPRVVFSASVHEWIEEEESPNETTRSELRRHSLLVRNAREELLPMWTSALAWVLCIGGSVACSVLVVLYGLTYGYHRSASWVRCNFFNVIVTEFVVHPAKLCFTSATMAVLRRPTEVENIPLRYID
ncbi:uncharacterized protein LOC135391009 isoform X2 [Ornithodoros turicata]|uniref:uncharacterized protein LOC135391009 isoform X2 n=1 Tax=Ornithodoros turicata TaxID=34597 RepID=UPI0031388A1D